MTYHEFLEALRKTKRDWYLESDGEIRITSSYLCPLVFLAPYEYLNENFVRAGQKLGLSVALSNRIAAAADGDMRNSKTRRDLLEACGLQEAVRR